MTGTRTCLGCGKLIPSGSRCSRCKLRKGVPAAIRKRILKRDGYRCQLRRKGCTGVATTVDHITPIVDGGSDSDRNLRAACLFCNSSRRSGR